MKKIILFIYAFLIIINLGFISSTHNITGYVENAIDGESANGKTIILWNYSSGAENNLTDIVGEGGNSKLSNRYSIDCDTSPISCKTGDILSIRVVNDGDSYLSEIKNITVSGAINTTIDNITLNSPPSTNMNFPKNNSFYSSNAISFNCSSEDLDKNLESIKLYGNWSGWHLNETKTISGNYSNVSFERNLEDGIYIYTCVSKDLLEIENKNNQNFSFIIDSIAPDILSVEINKSYSCEEDYIRINCTVTDELSGIEEVIVQAIKPSSVENYTAAFFSGNTYYKNIQINEVGEWRFRCFAKDFAENAENLESNIFNAYSNEPDLVVTQTSFLTENPIENALSIIQSNITNKGCTSSETFVVSFYENDLSSEIENKTIFLEGLSSKLVNVSWYTKIGPTNFFVFVDSMENISEYNESNNIKNKTFDINSWKIFYGGVSLNKLLATNTLNNLSMWFNDSITRGNLFITPKSGIINWLSLHAIGKKINGDDSSQDFSEIDSLLNMKGFNDSVSNIFSNNQVPKNTINLKIYEKEIEEIPIIISTNNSNFITGILWDSSKDNDNEFDFDDKENIVFVSQINKQKQGAYGIYDYEIRIPARLREYYDSQETYIYFYYELE